LHAVRRFLILAAIFVPISLAMATINEVSWLVLTDYYRKNYGILPSQLFALRCVGKSGCSPFFMEVIYTGVATLWIYVAWTALYISALTAAEVRNRDRRLVAAESAAHQAQLAVLRFQLNPHFLFNTLNTLSGLIALNRKDQAEQILMNLSAFLRRALRKESQQLVSLRSELEGEQMYLDIERARFGDRMRVELSIDPECESASVPAFILQPLVENSIKHAVAVAQNGVTIRLSAHKIDDQLILTVENSDPGADAPEHASGFGIGLENVQMRLAALYGRNAALAVKITADKHWQNTLTIPWREHSSDDAGTDR
jgi:LytS/YehU family sensor histidine kinase